MTIREEKLQNLLHQVDQHHQVDLLPLPRLVEFAEAGCFTDGQAEAYLREMLAPYDLSRYCTVVLGCTHFNYFKDSFNRILPEDIAMIDGSSGTVHNLHRDAGRTASAGDRQRQGDLLYIGPTGRSLAAPLSEPAAAAG